MSKLTNLLIPLVLISTGVISCTNLGFVKKKDVINQQFVNTVNQNGDHRQVLPQPEKENMTSQAGPVNIPTKKRPSSTTNTINRQSANKTIDKEHVDNLPGLEQDQIKLNQVGLAHLALGIAYTKRNLIDQAICEFQSATEENPHHRESHIRLGTAYGIKGMTNEAKSEFKKAINIALDNTVVKIVFNASPVAENTKKQTDLFKAHINLRDAYKKEAKFKKAQIVFEKALALKPDLPVAKKSLSEIYFSVGASLLENQEYDSAIVEFNKVLETNPDFPQIKDILGNSHYNLGMIYAENRKLDKAIIEFNKAMEVSHNYAMLDNSNLNFISKDKMAISGKRIHSDRFYSGENILVKKEADASPPNDQSNVDVATQANSSGAKAVANYKTNSGYRIYTYNITRNYKSEIGMNEAIKKYEDATIKNPYDNGAFLNLAHAYYCKAMYLDDAIAMREDTPEGNQNFTVKRFYLIDDASNIAFRNRSGNMYENMSHEAIIEYKNALRINPNSSNSSNSLYGLAFSFSIKGPSLGIVLNSKNNPKRSLFSY